MKTKRYVAFLRGVSPMNAKMPELKRAFERAGFRAVVTVLSSGNVVFDARAASLAGLEKKAEAAMAKHLGRTFLTIVRPVEKLEQLIAGDPFRVHRVPAAAKRVISFLRATPRPPPPLPLSRDNATIYAVQDREVLSAYLPGDDGPKLMALIERTFGQEITTRTWDTVAKCTRA